MLKAMRIKNFKGWEDTGEIQFAPLTVFFGTNSSGKTSLHQLLLLLKQTAQSSDRQRVLHLGDSHSVVDLGTFSEMLFEHDITRELDFSLDWRLPEQRRITISPTREREKEDFVSTDVAFHAAIGYHEPHVYVKEVTYGFGDPDNGGFRVGMVKEQVPSSKGPTYNLVGERYQPIRQQGRAWPLPAPTRFYGFPEEAIAYFQNTSFLPDMALELEQLLSRIHYVGPLREYPKRLYVWSGEIPEHVGGKGERAVDALIAAKERKISRGPNKRAEPFQVLIARWLQSMGLIQSFEVRPIASNRREYELVVRTWTRAAEVRITDVGFGVSQVLPVVVECFYVPRNAIIIFEQPEIHLHPSVQADLADLFIEAIHAREDGKDRNLQILVESHSEHFLRRLQRRVAEQTVKQEEVAMYFCDRGASRATIRRLETDTYGNINNWPENFFGDEMGDLVAMTEATLRRKQEGQAT